MLHLVRLQEALELQGKEIGVAIKAINIIVEEVVEQML
jgi:hypothetical protein